MSKVIKASELKLGDKIKLPNRSRFVTVMSLVGTNKLIHVILKDNTSKVYEGHEEVEIEK